MCIRDSSIFAPYLEKLIEAKKRYAAYVNPGGDVYDTLLDQFEKGMTQAQVDPLFDMLRRELVPLIRAVGEAGQPDTSFLEGPFDIDSQRQLSRYAMGRMGIR